MKMTLWEGYARGGQSLVLEDGGLVCVGFLVPREKVVISDQRRRWMLL